MEGSKIATKKNSKNSPPLAGGDKGEGEKMVCTLTPALSRQGRGKNSLSNKRIEGDQ